MHSAPDLCNPAEVARILERNGLHLRKGFGQNFLVDGNTRQIIIDAAGLEPSDEVLEVGGGIGTLGQAILPRSGGLTVVEIDERLIALLKQNIGGLGKLEVINSDIMSMDLRGLLESRRINKVVSNLPYNIAARLIISILEAAGRRLESMVVMVQKEVGRRLAADAGGEPYGLTSVLTRTLAEISTVHTVSKNVFIPKPKIDSVVLRLKPFEKPRLYEDMKEIARAAFSQRRKKAAKLISGGTGIPRQAIESMMTDSGIDIGARAEEIDPAQFLSLAGRIKGKF